MQFYNEKKALVNLQTQINNTQNYRKRFNNELTLNNRAVNSNEFLAEKLNSIRNQHPIRVKKSKSNLFSSSSSSSLYRQPILPNSFLTNPSPRVRLRNLACRTQPYRSFFTRLSTVFEEEDHPCNTTGSINDYSMNKQNCNNMKTQFVTNNLMNKASRLVSHKLNGSGGKKFKPTAYYSSFENEKNDIDYESFLYTDPSLNNSNNNNNKQLSNDNRNEFNQIEFNNINKNNNSNKKSNFSPLNIKPDFRIDATDKNILNEFNLLLLDELKRIKSRNQSNNNNNIESGNNNNIKFFRLSSSIGSENMMVKNDQQQQDIIDQSRQQAILECLIPNNKNRNQQHQVQQHQNQVKKQSVYTSTDNDEQQNGESHTVYKIMNSNPPIPPNLIINQKKQNQSKLMNQSATQINKNNNNNNNRTVESPSLSLSTSEAPKVRVITRGGEQMPPRPNKVHSPPISESNSVRLSPTSTRLKQVNPIESFNKQSSSPRTISQSKPNQNKKSLSPIKYINELTNKILQKQEQNGGYSYAEPYQNILNRKESSTTSQSSLSSYYNKLYSTDLRPEPYNYDDYLYKPSNYYEIEGNNNSKTLSFNYNNHGTKNDFNKLTDSFSSLLSLKNNNPQSPLPIQTISQEQPYHVASIPVVYVNTNKNDKVVINPPNSIQQQEISDKIKANRVVDIEEIKREIEREAEEIAENNALKLQKEQEQQQQQHQILQEIVEARDEEEEEEDDEAIIEDEEETTEEVSDKTTTEESTSEEIISEETTTSDDNNADETTGDEATEEGSANGSNASTNHQDSPASLIKLRTSPDPPPVIITSVRTDEDILLKEDQESELVNMIKDIKSTLESCCLSENQLKREQPFTNKDNLMDCNEKANIINQNKINNKVLKPNIRTLNVYNHMTKSNNPNDSNHIVMNNSINDNTMNNEEDTLINTSQDDYEENEYFEIVY